MNKYNRGLIFQGYMRNADGTLTLGALAGPVNMLGLHMNELADDINATRTELAAIKAALKSLHANLEAAAGGSDARSSAAASTLKSPGAAASSMAAAAGLKSPGAAPLPGARPTTLASAKHLSSGLSSRPPLLKK